ncbi:MAG TPA: YigZ family protein [Bacteroidales bacterium]|nr:YigZ family protein [Bacteroidales bacterium]HRU56274.1 YigZ family protein [Bacteroidales bacterium]
MNSSNDTYYTIESVSTGIFRDRGSKFLAFAHPVCSVDDAKKIIENYKKEYHDARHHCYAYVIGHENAVWRFNDDGEPSGTAGKPILSQINSRNLTNVLVVVVRYFGGTLLGTGGLINAYKTASAEALNNAIIIEKYIENLISIRFPYSRLNTVMKLLNDAKATIKKQEFGEQCEIIAGIRKSKHGIVIKKLSECRDIEILLPSQNGNEIFE